MHFPWLLCCSAASATSVVSAFSIRVYDMNIVCVRVFVFRLQKGWKYQEYLGKIWIKIVFLSNRFSSTRIYAVIFLCKFNVALKLNYVSDAITKWCEFATCAIPMGELSYLENSNLIRIFIHLNSKNKCKWKIIQIKCKYSLFLVNVFPA